MSWPDLGAIPPNWPTLRARREPARELRLVTTDLAGVLASVPDRLVPERLYGADDSLARFALLDGPEQTAVAARTIVPYVPTAVSIVDQQAREAGFADRTDARIAVALLHLLATLQAAGELDAAGDVERAETWLRVVEAGLPRYDVAYDVARSAAFAALVAGLDELARALWQWGVSELAEVGRLPPSEVAAVLEDTHPAASWSRLVTAFPVLQRRDETSWAELFAAGVALHRAESDVIAAIRADLP